MAARIAFVACSKMKADAAMPAAALYVSPLFRKSLLAAINEADRVYILSAKHGVLDLNTPVDPYDVTLKDMPAQARQKWGQLVGEQLNSLLRPGDTAVMYCGEEYLRPIRQSLEHLKARVEEPLGALSLGQRLQNLRITNQEDELEASLTRIKRQLRRLWSAQHGGRVINETDGRQNWPKRGVYLILENKSNKARGSGIPRIVRVGTHAVSAGSRTTLWDRLSTHRGTVAGGGSHRSSIFRLHVGRALTQQSPLETWPQTWSVGQTANADIRTLEAQLEGEVSREIGRMRILWLDIPDEPGPASERAYIERNLIAILSRAGLLSPISYRSWLGMHSPDWRIAASGLWNLNHVFARPDADFLNRFESCVDRTVGSTRPNAVDSDPSWQLKNQLNLFSERAQDDEI